MKRYDLSRRSVVSVTASTVALALLGSAWAPSASANGHDGALPQPRNKPTFDLEKFQRKSAQNLAKVKKAQKKVLTGVKSENGWEMEKVTDEGGSIWTRPVPGVPLEGVAVRLGEVETVLVHVIQRFHYEVENLRRGDVVGWRKPSTVRKGRAEGNQASGTAVQIRPGHYPHDAEGAFFPHQKIVIRDILATLDGTVRWGADDKHPDAALFSVAVGPDDRRLKEVADRIRRWQAAPGKGPGGPVDVLADDRRTAARALARRQRKS